MSSRHKQCSRFLHRTPGKPGSQLPVLRKPTPALQPRPVPPSTPPSPPRTTMGRRTTPWAARLHVEYHRQQEEHQSSDGGFRTYPRRQEEHQTRTRSKGTIVVEGHRRSTTISEVLAGSSPRGTTSESDIGDRRNRQQQQRHGFRLRQPSLTVRAVAKVDNGVARLEAVAARVPVAYPAVQRSLAVSHACLTGAISMLATQGGTTG